MFLDLKSFYTPFQYLDALGRSPNEFFFFTRKLSFYRCRWHARFKLRNGPWLAKKVLNVQVEYTACSCHAVTHLEIDKKDTVNLKTPDKLFSVHIYPGKFINDTHFEERFLKSSVFGDPKRRFRMDGRPIRVKTDALLNLPRSVWKELKTSI